MEFRVNPTFSGNSITYPKPPTSHDSRHHHNTHSCDSFCTTSATLTHRPTTYFPHQILPPPRPRKPLKFQPVKPPQPKPITTTTSSDVLRLMDALGLGIPLDLYVSLIKECIEARDASRAVELHAHINRSGVRPSLGLRNRLLLLYVSCGCMENARQVFDDMPVRDSNSWAVIVAGYADSGDYEAAIEFFVLFLRRHHFDGIGMLQGFPVSWMLVCILDACVRTSDLEIGKQIHGWLLKSGYLIDLFLSSSLINFYGKLGWSKGADLVFDQTSRRNVVVWTARIVNNCKEEQFDEVMRIFKEMGKEGVKKNSFTFSSVLRACAKMNGDAHCGEQVHAHVIKLGLASESYVQCSLVNMYGKFGLVTDANTVFVMNGARRNDACWNAMLTAYIRNGFFIEAIKLLYEMKAAGVQPHELLLNELRHACEYGFALCCWTSKRGHTYCRDSELGAQGWDRVSYQNVLVEVWAPFCNLLENAAFGLEILTPAFPLFVPIGAAAGAGQSTAALVQAATRSCFFVGFAAPRNFAEVILKESCSPQDMLKSLFHVSYLYWLENNVGLKTGNGYEDSRPGGKLQIWLEYVRREFNHVKLDSELAGWTTDGLIARPLPQNSSRQFAHCSNLLIQH